MSTLELKTRILPGGRIELQDSGLVEGREVVVRIVQEDESRLGKKSLPQDQTGSRVDQLSRGDEGEVPKRRISDILTDYPGGRLFKSAAEVNQYLKEERDSWGN